MDQTFRGAMELSVGELAERSGVSVSALHFYERQGLISSRRTAGNQRRYRRDMLRRVALIRMAQRVGIPLADVGAVLALFPPDHVPTRADWQRMSECWRKELDERIRRLQQIRDEFTDCIGCGCMSIDRCPLINPGDVLGRQGPGPRRLVGSGRPATGEAGAREPDVCGQPSGDGAAVPAGCRGGVPAEA
ncbi:redox-sensitive transcriptional activator SoxR [Sphaerisporangium sp. TRM90804]|uniref:redox-sensitive transcriptional activator SoxR n=1 Tax=Sphaerisporangium sp. TRM90804 TaxID=3031113 RepID=UPI0024469F4A|nr:redox-sensitive transcriptional activator SoxR [Sphaerisporangium sp. TRM90804]MDH2425525.1 redox-sensitive transcriptional activator SoxR [Sphaerisporangium sp. TRM90804]